MPLSDYELKYPPRTNLPPDAEVTRIAPSPTGRPHIGTALQATIDRALASKHGGVFILRIEDTDQSRLVAGAVEEIISTLAWLDTRPDEGPGIGGDYGPYVQSQRLDLYRTAAGHLVDHGHAYHCFCSTDRLDAVRKAQIERGEKPMYDGHCLTLPPAELQQRLDAGESSVIRMKIPKHTDITFTDEVRGPITFNSVEIDESVLLKSDGFPTYHLAVVVDDHFMRVTTVVRGEEWISSAPKHVLLYQYFGWAMPRLLHTPLLRDSDKRKLSKRSGDTSVAYYASQGIVPNALRNFLTRIIWPHPEDKDIYDYSEFATRFKPSELPKTGPVVDHALLSFINGHYVRLIPPAELFDLVLANIDALFAAGEGFRDSLLDEPDAVAIDQPSLETFRRLFAADRARSERILALGAERFKRVTDVLIQTRFYFAELFTPPTTEQLIHAAGDRALAHDFYTQYAAQSLPSKESWELYVRAEAKRLGVKVGKLFMALRIALTGSSMTPPLHEIIEILGESETSRRVGLAINATLES